MALGIPSLGGLLDSSGGHLSPPSFGRLAIFDDTQGPESAGSSSSAAEVVLALGLASLGSAVAGAALGSLVTYTEGGQARAPWEEKKLKVHAPLTPSDWSRAFDDATGRIKGGGQKAIGRVRVGGCSNSIRGEVWPFLLGLYDSNNTAAEREEGREQRRHRFEELAGMAHVITRRAKQEMEAKAKAEDSRKERASKEWRMEATAQSAKGRLEEEGLLVEGRGNDDNVVEEEMFCDAVEVSSAPSLEASTESFVDVSHADSEEASESHGPETSGQVDSTEVGVEFTSRSGTEDRVEEEPLVSAFSERVRDADRGSEYGGDISVSGRDDLDGEWEKLSTSLPSAYRMCPKEGESPLENFLVWKRIMRLDAVRMNAQWVPFSIQTEFPEEDSFAAVEDVEVLNHEHLNAAQRSHAARLVSILEAYAVLDPEIGYCQGMTDLLSPFVALIRDDSDAFWCFVRFMETARHNFRTDEVGIRKQLDLVAHILEVCDPGLFRHLSELGAQDCIFVYRMVIVLLRRELSFGQTVSLWEVLWAEAAAAASADGAAAAASTIGASVEVGNGPFALAPARPDFFLFVVAAIIVSRREAIMQFEGLDEVLRLCNSLAGELDVWELINRARSLVSLYSLLEGTEHDGP